MNSNSSHSHIREQVLEQIEQGKVRMKSRLFFVLKVCSVIGLAALVVLTSILIFCFIFFTLRLNGHDALVRLGYRGIMLFLQFFPWHLFILDIVLISLLRLLLKEFRFGYRQAWSSLVIFLLLVSMAGGIILDRGTPLNDQLLRHADNDDLPPPLRDLYEGARRPPEERLGEFRGMVTAVGTSTIRIVNPRHASSTFTVIIPTEGPDVGQEYRVGEPVVVIGDFDDGVVHAVGIHPFDPSGIPPK